jgi:two-component system chemotaxis sensor kinase CheA
MADSEALLKELMETFQLEAQDHLGALSTLLVELENQGDAAERARLVETVFRRMHTLKGAAHAVNRIDIAKSCEDLENLLADLKRGDIELDRELFNRLHAGVDSLTSRTIDRRTAAPGAPPVTESPAPSDTQARTEADATPSPAVPARRKTDSTAARELPAAGIPHPTGKHTAQYAAGAAGREQESPPYGATEAVERERLAAAAAKSHEPEQRVAHHDRGTAGETVRVSTHLLESLLLQAEELVSAKLAASALAEEVAAAAAELLARDSERARALDLARKTLRKAQPDAQAATLACAIEESCQAERHTLSRLHFLKKTAEKHLWELGGMVDPLLEDLKKLHLLPFWSLTNPFAKLVRDIARELDKEAELTCLGGELEVDRRILAELKEPLLHIVRNVMDHGIEKVPERRLKGKPDKGRISIEFRLQDANLAEIAISDDGRGIDLAQVKSAAVRLELITPEALERISDAEALQLIFESGTSTSQIITTISGRGVGLAIVRESVERLGGHVAVESRPGAGTEFRLRLPLSFAMMRGLLVECTGRACILPAANVELTTRVARAEIKRVENRDTVVLGGDVISLVSLARLLELDPSASENGDSMQPVVLLSAADRRIAFAVDQVVGVQEILVKPLGSQLSRVRNVAGATVLGNGRVVPILNIGDLFRSALIGAAAPLVGAHPSHHPTPKRLSVLVAEDSITSRTLLKNILESSGFLVATAIDGADALSQLKTESFDIVISDVEMPRMDGFELTAAIRGDSRWATLPVILVTGLESRPDRERGIDVGANAYIVKSSFDQSSLIEVIHKLT